MKSILMRWPSTGSKSHAVFPVAVRCLWKPITPSPIPIHTQVALDQILTEDVAAGRAKPAMRLWRWPVSDPAVVIGSFQSYSNEVDPDAVAKYGIKVARRISGGGAMFMEADNTVTY